MTAEQTIDKVQAAMMNSAWRYAKTQAICIGNSDGIDVFQTKVKGNLTFYVVRQNVVIGRIFAYDIGDGIQMNNTYIVADKRRRGYGLAAYRIIILTHGRVMSDFLRSPEADRLWLALQRDPELGIHFEGSGVDEDGCFVAEPLQKTDPKSSN